MSIIASSDTNTMIPASTPPGNSTTVRTHKHEEPSIADINWKIADELEFPDGNKGGKARSQSTTFGTKCVLEEGCAVPRTPTDLFDPDCPLDTVHSTCWGVVAKNENRGGKWKIPTSLVSKYQPSPGSNSSVRIHRENE